MTCRENTVVVKPQDKYGVFWYNEPEICHWKQKDFDAKAEEFAATGINIVMTFSCTHFRWNFYPWWDKINLALAKMVKACHKYNIRVVEHHSCHLTRNPRTAKDWKLLDRINEIRHGSLEMFPGLRHFIAAGDPEIRPGVYLSDCRQIDGRDGDFALTTYGGYGHCFNNPHFQAAYFDYLESIYRTGVDGIMTDDIAYKDFNACACPFCKEKFKASTGYDLPGPADWGRFHGNYNDPAFLAWVKFRMDSTNAFQRAVSAHAAKLGYNMLRPNYIVSTFGGNQTAYPFEGVGDLWSCVFQENMYSTVIHTDWPCWTGDAAHRLAMANRYGIMAMSMFYPVRYDDYYFSWSLAKAWNHLLMATPEGGDLNDVEKKFYAYDKAHPIIENAEPVADIAFLQPRTAFDYTKDSFESSRRPLTVWLQAAAFRNLQHTVVFEDQSLDVWKRHKFIAVIGGTMFSDAILKKLKKYCDAGGRLLLFGAFGMYKEDGSIRKNPGKIFGIESRISDFIPVSAGVFTWNGKTIKLPAVKESRTFLDVKGKDVQVIAKGNDGEIFGISAMNGNVIWLAGGIRSRNPEASHYGATVSRWRNSPDTRVTAPPYAADYLYKIPGAILGTLLPAPQTIHCSHKDYLISFFMNKDHDRGEIHLVNVSGTLYKPPAEVSHLDTLSNFIPRAEKIKNDLQLTIYLPDGFHPSDKIAGYSPELKKTLNIPYSLAGRKLKLTIPSGTFAGYLKICLA